MNACLSLRLEIVQISGKDKSETLSSNMSARGVRGCRFLDSDKVMKCFPIHKGVLRLTGVVLVGTFQPFIKKEKSPRNCFRGRFHVKEDQFSISSTSLAMTSKTLLSVPSAAAYLCILMRPMTWTAAPFWSWSRFLMVSLSHATMRNQVVSMT